MIGLVGFAVIAGAGWSGRLPRRWVLVGLAVWWALAVLTSAPLWMGGGRAALLGGDFVGWILLGVLAVLVMGYRLILLRVRSRIALPATASAVLPVKGEAFAAAELDRYARHILLREIGGQGQRRLKDARVLVLGAGGLGSPALLYLAASGVGTLGVIDDDVVEASNLQRQIIHTAGRIGMPKVFSAQIAIADLNPHVTLRPYNRRLDAANAAALIADYDLVLDGSDNFDTRYLVNATCAALGKPLISAAITQWEGQLSLYDPTQDAPCYACIFPHRPAAGLVPSCAEAGVAAPLPGIIGSMMAMEAVKHLTGAGETLRNRLLIHDALEMETRMIRIARRDDCAVCGAH
jgi:molybdopterin-synthase adenylyltransferase